MPDTEEKDPYAYTVPITLAAIKVEEPEVYWLKKIRGTLYLSDGNVTRFSGRPRRYSFIDLCDATYNGINPDYATYLVSVKLTDSEYCDLINPKFTGKVNFTNIEVTDRDHDTIVELHKPVYTHVYNRRNKCLEPNMVFEFTEETVIIHDHLTQTEYNTLLEL